MMMITNWLDAA